MPYPDYRRSLGTPSREQGRGNRALEKADLETFTWGLNWDWASEKD